MSAWLFVESEHNRNQDQLNNYNYLGVNEKKIKKLNIQKNDLVFTYISRIMKFSDLRKIISSELYLLPNEINYDKEFKYCIKTKLIKSLDHDKWIDRHKIFHKLNLMWGKSHNFVLLSSPVILDEQDKNFLLKFFK
jgi:hypothetical protein|tara:strand:- start:66 stop:473 length:408 start_codon:yes stop_codon:yes gene_type:complete